MNKCVLIGRLTRDAEIRYIQGQNGDQMAIARFTLAVDRKGKDGGADFISCVAFGRTAEFCEKWTRQGMKVALDGRIQTGSYTNKEGAKVYTTDVIVENIEFAESKNAEKPADAPKSDAGFISIPEGIENDLPFK